MNDPEIHVYKLSNGIRVVHLPLARSVVHCGLMINAGSRDELENEHGLAHFIEHCLFKGTAKRKTYHILNRLDSVGGDLNAFTSKEETWIHASVLNEHLERAVDLIADIAFNPTFPEHELVKEREVICDEIESYLDNPTEMLFEEFENILFRNHPLGRSILGTEKSLNTLHRDDLIQFIERRKSSQNFVLSVVGFSDRKALQQMLEKHLGHIAMEKKTGLRKKFKGNGPHHITEHKDVHQVQWVAGCTAYSYNQAERLGLGLLNNILGGPSMNNRLSMSLREKHGLTYNVESNYQPMSDTGLFFIYLGVDKQNFEKSKSLLGHELKLLRTKKLSPLQMHRMKKQVIGQIALSQDNSPALMFALGKSVLLYNKIDTLEVIFKQIESVSARDVLHIANAMLDEKKWSSLTYFSSK